jgi:hypothetical protein
VAKRYCARPRVHSPDQCLATFPPVPSCIDVGSRLVDGSFNRCDREFDSNEIDVNDFQPKNDPRSSTLRGFNSR